MKKITLCLMLILALVLPVAVLATEPVVDTTTVEKVSTEKDLRDALEAGKSVELEGDIKLSNKTSKEGYTDRNAAIVIDGEGSIIIKGNGHTISFDAARTIFEIYATGTKKLNVKLENVNLEANAAGGRCISTYTGNIDLDINNSSLKTSKGSYDQTLTIGGDPASNINVNITNSNISAASHYAIIAFNPINLKINSSSVKGYAAIYMKDNTTGSKITIDEQSGIRGINNSSGDGNHFGAIVLEDSGITIDVKGMSFIGTEENGTAYEFALMDKVGNNTITVSDSVIEAPRCSLWYKNTTKLTLGDMTEICDPSIASNLDVLKGFMPKDAIYKSEVKNRYTIHEKNTIKVNNPEKGGKIEVIPSSAYAGDVVEIKVTVDEGYKLDRIGYGTGNLGGAIAGDELLAEKITFEVPGGKVSMTPVFIELPKAEVSDSVENKEKVESMVLESLNELVTKDEKLAEKIEGKAVTVEIGDPAPVKVEKEEKELFEKEAAKKVEDITVAEYMDISISIIDKETKTEIDKISNVKEAIKFTIKVPEKLKTGVAEGFKRIFYIIRNHNGIIDVLETKEVDGKLSFESDKFSTYAIAYKDIKDDVTTGEEVKPEVKPEDKPVVEEEKPVVDTEKPATPDVPKTGDNVVVYAVIAVVAIAGMTVTIKSRKK